MYAALINFSKNLSLNIWTCLSMTETLNEIGTVEIKWENQWVTKSILFRTHSNISRNHSHVCLFSSFSENVYEKESIATKRVFISSSLFKCVSLRNYWISFRTWGLSIHITKTSAIKTVLQKSSMCIQHIIDKHIDRLSHTHVERYLNERVMCAIQWKWCDISAFFCLPMNQPIHARRRNTFDVKRKHGL